MKIRHGTSIQFLTVQLLVVPSWGKQNNMEREPGTGLHCVESKWWL